MAEKLNFSQIRNMRLAAQQLVSQQFKKPGELVKWMGAVQAQDAWMARYAIALRSAGSAQEVKSALDKGKILRTHVLRPTWHIVAAEDIRWMLALSADRLRSAMQTRHRELGIDAKMLRKSETILQKALEGKKHKTREELAALYEHAGINTGDNRLSHLLYSAETEGLICSGPSERGKPSYALLDDRVKTAKPLAKEEALQKLALRYFNSHGPATLKDFTWWSGLSAPDARRALECASDRLRQFTCEGEKFYCGPEVLQIKSRGRNCILLPAYDEFLISYSDRRASLPVPHKGKALSSNGIFYPVILSKGQVLGTWKRTIKKKELIISISYFEKEKKLSERLIRGAAAGLCRFADCSGINILDE